MWEWLDRHQDWLWWVAAGSFVLLLATIFFVPWLMVWIPADYFARPKERPAWFSRRHPALRLTLLVIKNVLGAALLATGLVMILVPVPGLVVIPIMGVSLIDFPGKYAAQRWLVMRPSVHRTINWLRRRKGRPPLQLPSALDSQPSHQKA